ncbi:MAG: ATP-binding cassette domain-containing protein [Lachnospiraceae bacterium]|nr:ATP-binding cassette domain-containing protein [Lachnospiraceae bacterium]
MAFVETKQLKKYFKTPGGTLHAVDNVSISIEKGETLGVVGESGCGKSTFGKTLMKLHEPTSGEIWFDGVNIAPLGPKEFKPYRSRIQMIFQDPYASLDPRMNIRSLIAEPLTVLGGMKDKKEIAKKVDELMNSVGLARRLGNSYPHELDGGRRQRIGVARALALNPEFIICDEPVSALDVSIQAQILNLLQDLQEERGLTYVFITHDMSVVKHIANEIMVMYLGQAVEKCNSKELFRNTLHPYSKALLSAIPVPSIHVERKPIPLQGELSSPINPKPCCRFAVRCPYATDQCRSEEPELREYCPGHFVACHRIGEI